MALIPALTAAASEERLRSGFGGATTVSPALSSSRITPAKPDASANAPWMRTIVGSLIGFSCLRLESDAASVGPARAVRHRQLHRLGRAGARSRIGVSRACKG